MVSPDQLAVETLSPASFNSPTQATGYGTNQPNGYFYPYANYQQYSVGQGQHQMANGPQNQEFYHSPRIGSFTPSLPPGQPMQDNNKPATVVDNSNPDVYRCPECGKKCKRQTDLERHLNTAKRHKPQPSGPACPERGCRYPLRFTRADNFKAHYKKQHEKSGEEAEEVIQQWKDSDGGRGLVKAALIGKRRGSRGGGR